RHRAPDDVGAPDDGGSPHDCGTADALADDARAPDEVGAPDDVVALLVPARTPDDVVVFEVAAGAPDAVVVLAVAERAPHGVRAADDVGRQEVIPDPRRVAVPDLAAPEARLAVDHGDRRDRLQPHGPDRPRRVDARGEQDRACGVDLPRALGQV